jgi:hypothetical protein
MDTAFSALFCIESKFKASVHNEVILFIVIEEALIEFPTRIAKIPRHYSHRKKDNHRALVRPYSEAHV